MTDLTPYSKSPEMTDNDHIAFHLILGGKGDDFSQLDEPFRPYAELWGKDSEGNDVPICWMTGISEVKGIHPPFCLQ